MLRKTCQFITHPPAISYHQQPFKDTVKSLVFALFTSDSVPVERGRNLLSICLLLVLGDIHQQSYPCKTISIWNIRLLFKYKRLIIGVMVFPSYRIITQFYTIYIIVTQFLSGLSGDWCANYLSYQYYYDEQSFPFSVFCTDCGPGCWIVYISSNWLPFLSHQIPSGNPWL